MQPGVSTILLVAAAAAAGAVVLGLPLSETRTRDGVEVVGPVVVIGGGGDVPDIVRKFIQLSGGSDARILVLPISTQQENPGQAMAAFFRENGGTDVGIWLPGKPADIDSEASLSALREARGLYFSGGDQKRGMTLLRGTKALEEIRARHRAGACIGGSSAGAALLSEVMIDGAKPEGALEVGRFTTSEGLGITGHFITDQHYLARGRMQRLVNVLLDHPTYRGLGVDERTAAILHPDRIEVTGEGQVVLIDAPEGQASRSVGARQLYSAQGVKLRVLLPGDSISRK